MSNEMKYDTRWLDDLDLSDFDRQTRKVLLLLCHRKYKWRTEGNLSRKSGLKREEVAEILDQLRKKKIISLSLSDKQHVIYGLTTRVK
jgi:RIO-like serine/threonine protein kinase